MKSRFQYETAFLKVKIGLNPLKILYSKEFYYSFSKSELYCSKINLFNLSSCYFLPFSSTSLLYTNCYTSRNCWQCVQFHLLSDFGKPIQFSLQVHLPIVHLL